ncbi:MAG: nitroreductase family protein [Eubacteriales bacterium]
MCENNMSLHSAIQNRRSVYNIGRNVSITDEEIISLVNHSVKFEPTAFNSQSARVAVLLGEHHKRLWEIAKEILHKLLPGGQYAKTEEKLNGFEAGYGTILYFENQHTVNSLRLKYPIFAGTFPKWSLESSGMLQYSVWTSLEAIGLGASLQHYNPLIDKQVRKEWDFPKNWKLIAEMPFGSLEKQPDEKTFLPLEERVKIFK